MSRKIGFSKTLSWAEPGFSSIESGVSSVWIVLVILNIRFRVYFISNKLISCLEFTQLFE